jgi:cyanophycin synthetase
MTLSKNCARRKTVAVYENGYITIKKGEWKIRIERASHVPLTLEGRLNHDCKCTCRHKLKLFMGIKTEDISLSLQTFIPSAAQTRDV